MIAHVVYWIFFSQILPFISPFYSHCHFAESEPHLSCCSSFLTGSLSPLFPSCSSKGGREQSQEDQGHVMDTQAKETGQTSRKVTLTEVRGSHLSRHGESHIKEPTGSFRRNQESHVTESTGRFRRNQESHVTESTGKFRKGIVNKDTCQREQKQIGTEKCL